MDDRYFFDEKAAQRAVLFFEKYLRHSEGEWAGKKFKLEDWEKNDIVRPLFGWKRRSDGTRRYRTAYIEVPKKNGKSGIAAGIALYMAFADMEPGAQVFSAAGDRDQAAIVFDTAKNMVLASPALSRRSQPYRRVIHVPYLGASYRVISADAKTKHGFNVHCAVFDEFHVQPNRELFDTLKNGVAARRQPLVVIITTAGHDRNSICWEMHDYALKVKNNIIEDNELLVVVYAAEKDDDWTDPKIWKKANPNLGITVKEDFLKSECEKAKRMPSYENTFRRLHLNQWVEAERRWFSIRDWDKGNEAVARADLQRKPCYAGLDLSSTRDLSALSLVFPLYDELPLNAENESASRDVYKILPFFWIPEENMREREARDQVPYSVWIREGFITATPGNVIDYKFIFEALKKLREEFDILEIAYDRWGASKLTQDLQEASFNMVPFGQGFGSMSAPSKELERLVLSGRIHHGGNPILRWNADNVVTVSDAAGNIKPDKAKSNKRIDGIVAAIMGLDRAIRHNQNAGTSIYESRGFASMGGAKAGTP